jgi:hypothetical protein
MIYFRSLKIGILATFGFVALTACSGPASSPLTQASSSQMTISAADLLDSFKELSVNHGAEIKALQGMSMRSYLDRLIASSQITSVTIDGVTFSGVHDSLVAHKEQILAASANFANVGQAMAKGGFDSNWFSTVNVNDLRSGLQTIAGKRSTLNLADSGTADAGTPDPNAAADQPAAPAPAPGSDNIGHHTAGALGCKIINGAENIGWGAGALAAFPQLMPVGHWIAKPSNVAAIVLSGVAGTSAIASWLFCP